MEGEALGVEPSGLWCECPAQELLPSIKYKDSEKFPNIGKGWPLFGCVFEVKEQRNQIDQKCFQFISQI